MCELELFQSALFLLWLSSQCSGKNILFQFFCFGAAVMEVVVFSIGCVEKYCCEVSFSF